MDAFWAEHFAGDANVLKGPEEVCAVHFDGRVLSTCGLFGCLLLCPNGTRFNRKDKSALVGCGCIQVNRAAINSLNLKFQKDTTKYNISIQLERHEIC